MSTTDPRRSGRGERLSPRQVLSVPRVWMLPAAVLSVISVLLTIAYLGGILNPRGDLRHMPVGLVDADTGTTVSGLPLHLGTQVTAQITGADQSQIAWTVLDHATAMERLDGGHLYAVVEIPHDFSADVTALTAPAGAVAATAASARPTITVYTNPAAGSLASSLASSSAQATVAAVSSALGKQLTAHVPPHGLSAAARLMLQDPVKAVVTVGHPLGTHSGLGLTAFYYTLLLVLAGFLGANIISNGVDVSLGYAAADLGPLRRQAPQREISRRDHFLVTAAMSVVLSAITATLVLLTAVYLVGMDYAHLPQLWLFSVCAAAAVSVGVQTLLAVFGGLGQPIAMLLFIAYSLPSSGATVPLEALPSFYRFLGAFEPMRQLTGGVRAILYFDAQGDAGLTRGWIAMAAATAAALAFGLAMTASYDRRGLHRGGQSY